MVKKTLCLLIVLVVVPLLVLAEETGEPERMEIHVVDGSAFPLIMLSYSLKDADDKYTYSPGADFFEVVENGTREEVFGFDEEHAPASLVLILDSSGSMEGSMDEVRQAASSLIGMLDEDDEAQIVDFDSRVKVAHEFSDDRGSMRSVLGSITVGGSTALYDAIAQGIQDVSARRGLRALVLLTDGKDESAEGKRQSKTSFDEFRTQDNPGLPAGIDRHMS